jgi:hypothetical protein
LRPLGRLGGAVGAGLPTVRAANGLRCRNGVISHLVPSLSADEQAAVRVLEHTQWRAVKPGTGLLASGPGRANEGKYRRLTIVVFDNIYS